MWRVWVVDLGNGGGGGGMLVYVDPSVGSARACVHGRPCKGHRVAVWKPWCGWVVFLADVLLGPPAPSSCPFFVQHRLQCTLHGRQCRAPPGQKIVPTRRLFAAAGSRALAACCLSCNRRHRLILLSGTPLSRSMFCRVECTQQEDRIAALLGSHV